MNRKRIRGKVTFEGVPYYVSGYTDKEIEDAKRKKLNELEKDAVIIDPSMSVKDWGKQWYVKYRKRTSASTAKNEDYKRRLFKYVYPKIGHMKVSKVRSIHLRGVLNDMADEGYSHDRIAKAMQCLKQMFDVAEENGMLLKNPSTLLKVPDCKENGKGREFTKEERRDLMTVLSENQSTEWAIWYELMLFCGLRPGELDKIRAKDVGKDVLYIEGTKSDRSKKKASRRYVPVPPFITSKLTVLARGKSEDAPLLLNSVGAKVNANNITAKWNQIRRIINLKYGCKTYRNKIKDPYTAKDFIPYCCRHTYYNDLKYSGVPFAIYEEVMGHSLDDTSSHYSHERKDGPKIVAEALNKYWMDNYIINPYTGSLFSQDVYYGKPNTDVPDNVISIAEAMKKTV